MQNIRWRQRFDNYLKALRTLDEAMALAQQRPLSDLEQQGLSQGFEYTHELAWNVLKDSLEHQGIFGVVGARDATRIQEVLARFPSIEKALLYGSRARNDHKPGSDIDLAFCGSALTTKQLAIIAWELDDLLLPYTLDLLIVDLLDHHDLQHSILREGKIFYVRQT